MSFLRKLLGLGPAPDLKKLVKEGAIIIDVRSKAEFKQGHVKSSKCYPLERLNHDFKNIKKDHVIITCCQSGARSGVARRILKSKGYSKVYNGGGWMRLQNKLK